MMFQVSRLFEDNNINSLAPLSSSPLFVDEGSIVFTIQNDEVSLMSIFTYADQFLKV